MKRLSRIAEAEVVCEFLKSEFYHPEYDRDRSRFEPLVYSPDLGDEMENALRRALLFRRRGHMWRELPPDTQWWEMEFSPAEAEQVRIFPRAQWRAPASGNFAVLHVAGQIRREMHSGHPGALAAKISAMSSLLQQEGAKSTILLIGLDEQKPLTILEGNHRFVAALMLPPEIMFRRIRVACGLSPDMEKCCWYKTNFPTLAHYLKNRIKYFWDREADVYRLISQTISQTTAPVRAGEFSAPVETPPAKSK
jgi:hypothetical protein